MKRAEADGDPAGAALARALAARMRLGMLATSVDEQEQLALAALPLLEAVGDHAGLSAIWISLADGVYNFRGRYADAEHAAEQGAPCTQRWPESGRTRTFSRSLCTSDLGRPPMRSDGSTCWRRTTRIRAIDLRRAVILAMLDRMEEARTLAETQRGAYPGLRCHEVAVLHSSRRSRSSTGTPRLRPSCFVSSASASPSTGAPHCFPPVAPQRGRLLCALGRYDEAARLAAQGQELGDEDDGIQQALWRQTAAWSTPTEVSTVTRSASLARR